MGAQLVGGLGEGGLAGEEEESLAFREDLKLDFNLDLLAVDDALLHPLLLLGRELHDGVSKQIRVGPGANCTNERKAN